MSDYKWYKYTVLLVLGYFFASYIFELLVAIFGAYGLFYLLHRYIIIVPIIYSFKLLKERYYGTGSVLFLSSLLVVSTAPLLEFFLTGRGIYYTHEDIQFLEGLASLPFYLLAVISSVRIIKFKHLKFGIPALVLSVLVLLFVIVSSFLFFVFQGLK